MKALGNEFKSNSPKTDSHSFTTVQEEGYFLESIRKQVRKQQIDLIVMGTRGASEIKEFFMECHAGDVLTKVECDVLIVPDEASYQEFKQVILPIDFETDVSDLILKKIVSTIGSEKAEIKLLYVTKSDIPLFKNVEIQQQQLRERLSKTIANPVSFHRVVSQKIEDGVRIFSKT